MISITLTNLHLLSSKKFRLAKKTLCVICLEEEDPHVLDVSLHHSQSRLGWRLSNYYLMNLNVDHILNACINVYPYAKEKR